MSNNQKQPGNGPRGDRGYLYKNEDKRGNPNAPDWKGKLTYRGEEMYVSAWEKNKDGKTFLSLSATDPATRPSRPSPAHQPASGQPASGQPASGQPASGQPASGQPASGQPASGQHSPSASRLAPAGPHQAATQSDRPLSEAERETLALGDIFDVGAPPG